jgi:hypothetical protein
MLKWFEPYISDCHSYVLIFFLIAIPAVNQNDSFVRFFENEEPYDNKHGQQTQILKSIDFTQSRSTFDGLLRHHEPATNRGTFASIIASPITTKLTSLSTFIPFSWSAATRTAPAAICIAPSTSDSSMGSSPSGSRLNGWIATQRQQASKASGFVSRQKQLAKLKTRMEMEGKQQLNFSANPHCKNCADGIVLL